MRLPLVAALLLAAAGCKEPNPFDVDRAGRIVVALDGRGRYALTGGEETQRDLYLIEPRAGGESEVRRLTRDARPRSWPVFAPDGKSIAYIQGNGLRLLDLGSGEERELYGGGDRLYWPLFSPDGAYIACHETPAFLEQRGKVVLVEVATGESAVLQENALVGHVWFDMPLGPILFCVEATGEVEGSPGLFEGRLVRVEARTKSRKPLGTGRFAGLVWIAADPVRPRAFCLLPESGGAAFAVHSFGMQRPECVPLALRPEGSKFFLTLSPDGERFLYTASKTGDGTLEGSLYVSAGPEEEARPVPTEDVVSCPRWVGDRVAYGTPDGRLLLSPLTGKGTEDLTARCRRAR